MRRAGADGVNEDENGITPPNVTAMTVEPARSGTGWSVIIEQGNGDVIKTLELTEMERIQLAAMICTELGEPPTLLHLGFVDFSRAEPERADAT